MSFVNGIIYGAAKLIGAVLAGWIVGHIIGLVLLRLRDGNWQVKKAFHSLTLEVFKTTSDEGENQ